MSWSLLRRGRAQHMGGPTRAVLKRKAYVTALAVGAAQVLALPSAVTSPAVAVTDSDASGEELGAQATHPVGLSEGLTVPDWDPGVFVPPTVVLPEPIEFSARLGAAPTGAGPIAVAVPDAGVTAKGFEVPASVGVEVLDRATSAKLGDGLLAFRVQRTDGVAPSGQNGAVALQVDYSSFAGAFGAGYADRLRLLKYPECVLSTPEVTACRQAVVVEVDNEPNVGTLTATVDTDSGTSVAAAGLLAAPASFDEPAPAAGFAASRSPLALSPLVMGTGGGGGGVYALSSGSTGLTGDFKATTLKAAGMWQVGLQAGDFTWSYPVPAPPVPVGGSVSLSLNYSSQSVDGMTSSENTQPGPEGLGWSLGGLGFIERRYVPCSEDVGGGTIPDLCWYTDNATISLKGQSSELVYTGTDTGGNTASWRLKDDPGWKVTRSATCTGNGDNNGECWVVTTQDGTKYYFGKGVAANDATPTKSVQWAPVYGNHSNEQCYDANINAAYCNQAYRWNLDRIEDLDGNIVQVFYGNATNWYLRGGAADDDYIRDAWPISIEQGIRADSPREPSGYAFGFKDRCVENVADPNASCAGVPNGSYPDAPLDLECDGPSETCSERSPTFFTKKRLHSITTWTNDGTLTRGVDELRLTHAYPTTSSGHTMLWLDAIRRVGDPDLAFYDGVEQHLPRVEFDGVPLASRDDSQPFVLYRIDAIRDELAGLTTVSYGQPKPCTTIPPNGTWNRNDTNCFEVWTSPENELPGWARHNKWLVTSVTRGSNGWNGGSPAQTWTYLYGYTTNPYTVSPPADEAYLWAWDADPLVTSNHQHNDWRGYPKVVVTTGTSVTEYRYFRGMDDDDYNGTTRNVSVVDSEGTAIVDDEPLAGKLRETRRLDGGSGPRVDGSLHTYAFTQQTGTQALSTYALQFTPRRSHYVRESKVITRVGSGTGASTSTETVNTWDTTYGTLTNVHEKGNTAITTDDRCTKYTPHRNATIWLVNLNREEILLDGTCASTTKRRWTKTYFDGLSFAAQPVKGHPTRVDRYTASTTFITTNAGYDAYGRVTSETNGRGFVTTTTYTPANTNGYVTHTARTVDSGASPANNLVTTSVLDLRRGLPTQVTDPNGRTTTTTYDALGRVTAVKLPTETMNNSYEYVYTLAPNNDAAPKVLTRRLYQASPAAYRETYEIFDADGRLRQTHTAAPPGSVGTTVVNVSYDSRGLTRTESLPFNAPTFSPGQGIVSLNGTHHEYSYDNAERLTSDVFKNGTTVISTSTTEYSGLSTTTITPEGRRAVVTKDVFGRVVTAVAEYTNTVDYATTTNTYNVRDELVATTHPDGKTSAYAYDWLGRLTDHNDPDRGLWRFAFDGNGNQTGSRDAKNVWIYTNYDRLDRPTDTREDNASSTGTLRVLREYYPGSTYKGMLEKVTSTDEAGLQYSVRVDSYDDRYRPTRRTTTVPNPAGGAALSFTYDYAYNSADQPTSITYPATQGLASETVTTDYDGATGAATQLLGQFNAAPPTQSYVVGTSFESDGLIAGRTYGPASGIQINRTFAYYADSRRLGDMAATTSTGSLVHKEGLQYDDDSNITRIRDYVNDQYQCFDYDDFSRLNRAWTILTTATTGGQTGCTANPASDQTGYAWYDHTYLYNNVGGVTSVNLNGDVEQHDFEDTTHPRAVTDTDEEDFYTYDANGARLTHTLGASTESYTWTKSRMLRQVANSAGTTTSFSYDGDGNRIARRVTTAGVITTTYWIEGQELTHNGTTWTVDRTYTIGATPAAIRNYTGTANGTLHWLFANHQASASHTLEWNGSTPMPVQHQYYTPYGAVRGTPNQLATNNGFLNKPEDDTTNLNHLGAREYDPTIMRFVNVDPLVAETAEPFAYSSNNPSTFTDPSGLRKKPPMRGGGGGFSGKGMSVAMRSGAKGGHGGGGGGGGGVAVVASALGGIVGTILWSASESSPSFSDTAIDIVASTIDIELTPQEWEAWRKGVRGDPDDPADPALRASAMDKLDRQANGDVPVESGLDAARRKARSAGLSEETISLAESHIADNGETVIGHLSPDDYIGKAERRGASYFDLGDHWNELSPAQRTAANAYFLDLAIARGDRIILATEKSYIRPKSALAWEISYLRQAGYRWVNQWAMTAQ